MDAESKIQLDRITGDITDKQADDLLELIESGNCFLTECENCPLDGKYCE